MSKIKKFEEYNKSDKYLNEAAYDAPDKESFIIDMNPKEGSVRDLVPSLTDALENAENGELKVYIKNSSHMHPLDLLDLVKKEFKERGDERDVRFFYKPGSDWIRAKKIGIDEKYSNIKEGYTEAEPIVAPDTITKPKKKTGHPSPIRRDKPSVAPGPKAVEKLANRFLNLTKNDESVKELLRKKYNK